MGIAPAFLWLGAIRATAESLVQPASGAGFAPHLRLRRRTQRDLCVLRATQVAHYRRRKLIGVSVSLSSMGEAPEHVRDTQPDQRPSDEDCSPRHPVHALLSMQEVRLAISMTIS